MTYFSAVDGNHNTVMGRGSCTHTKNDMNAWWVVDLKDTYLIDSVVLINRGDCCSK